MFSWLTVKQPKAEEGGAVKGTWNKWPVRKRLVGLCRESPLLPWLRGLPLR